MVSEFKRFANCQAAPASTLHHPPGAACTHAYKRSRIDPQSSWLPQLVGGCCAPKFAEMAKCLRRAGRERHLMGGGPLVAFLLHAPPLQRSIREGVLLGVPILHVATLVTGALEPQL